MLTLNLVLEMLSGQAGWPGSQMINSVVIDSRLAQPGDLFVAFKGHDEDGHEHAVDAFENGAIAALVEKPVSSDLMAVDLRA